MTYLPNHILTIICDYCSETIEQRQRRLWKSIGSIREEDSRRIICKVYNKNYGPYLLHKTSYIKLLTCSDSCGMCDLDGNLEDLCREDTYWKAINEHILPEFCYVSKFPLSNFGRK